MREGRRQGNHGTSSQFLASDPDESGRTRTGPAGSVGRCAARLEARGGRRAEHRASELPRYRYRLRFEKTGRLQFLGHLDLTRAMLRAFRRARIALVYSQGFNPKPRVQFGPALSVGIESYGEYLDFWSFDVLDPGDAMAAVNESLPRGLRVSALRDVAIDAPVFRSRCARRTTSPIFRTA